MAIIPELSMLSLLNCSTMVYSILDCILSNKDNTNFPNSMIQVTSQIFTLDNDLEQSDQGLLYSVCL